MRNFKSYLTMFVVPALLTFTLAFVAKWAVNSQVPVVVDSGERWYNPLSWSLDEASTIAHEQAVQAANIANAGYWALAVAMAIGVTTVTWAGVSGRLGIEQKAEQEETEETEAPKAKRQTPPEKAPRIVRAGNVEVEYVTSTDQDDVKDEVLTGAPAATATGKKK